MLVSDIEAKLILYYFPDEYEFNDKPELLVAIHTGKEQNTEFSNYALWLLLKTLPIDGGPGITPFCEILKHKACKELLKNEYPDEWHLIQGNDMVEQLKEEASANEDTNKDSGEGSTEDAGTGEESKAGRILPESKDRDNEKDSSSDTLIPEEFGVKECGTED